MAKTKEIYLISYGADQMSGVTGTIYGENESIVGRSVLTGATFTYVAAYMPGSTGLSAQATVRSLTLPIGTRWDTAGKEVSLVIPPSPMNAWAGGDPYAERYNKVMSAQEYGRYSTASPVTVTVTDAATISRILTNGFGLRPYTSGDWTVFTTVDDDDVLITYEDPLEAPDIAATVPASVCLTDALPITWTYEQSADVSQSGVDITLENVTTGKTVTVADKLSLLGHSYSVSLPTAGIGTGEVIVRVRAYTTGNTVASKWSEARTTLTNASAVILSPRGGENKLATESIRLLWERADSGSGSVYGWDLDISRDGGETWTAYLTKANPQTSGNAFYYDIPADTLYHGTVRWRVRPWSTEDSAGEYAVDAFQAVIQASTSAVTCDGKPHPTLAWDSESQVAFSVEFADYKSGAVYGTAQSYTVPRIYPDGLYAVRVRTQASTGVWSPWTETQYVQIANTTPSGSVTVTAERGRHAVSIAWTVGGTFEGYVLYRDGRAIYAGTATAYTDNTAVGRVAYTVRAVTAAGNYTESSAVTVYATPDTDCVMDVDTATWYPLRYSAEPRTASVSDREEVTYRHFAGRTYPVAFTDGFAERNASLRYAFRRREDAEAVAALRGREVIVKTKRGRVLHGIINDVQTEDAIVHGLSFTVVVTDSEREADYAV